MIVTFANACYSGGGIYLYNGALEDGRYFLASDDFGIALFDVMPDFDYDMSFFDAHVIDFIEIDSEDHKVLFSSIFSWIETNQPEGNYNIEEIKARKEKGSYFEAVEHDILMGRTLDSAMQSN